ncbi:MAG: hypothetical protein IID37_15080 [Planctomycetes bacterium]|nr:hypothetical protein [Planctomycetota bacterium]
MKRSNVILIAMLGLVLVVGPAQGADRYFCASGASGDWDDGLGGLNWDSNAACTDGNPGVPTAADRAIIQSGKTCNVDVTTAAADSLNVESGATLNIQAGKKLTIDDTAGSSTTIAGTLNLQGASSELAFIDNSQTIDGAGKIVGQHNAAKITVALSTTLTSDSTIEGNLQITGLGDFVNTGTVQASVAGILAITAKSIEDDSTALWKISGSSGAILKINVSDPTSAVLDGDFEIFDDGKLEVDSEGFTTTGTLDWRGGKIDVAIGSSVEFGTL